MLMWKIVGTSKVSVLYRYIDNTAFLSSLSLTLRPLSFAPLFLSLSNQTQITPKKTSMNTLYKQSQITRKISTTTILKNAQNQHNNNTKISKSIKKVPKSLQKMHKKYIF